MLWMLWISDCSATEMENRLAGWKRELLRAHGLIAGLFARSEARGRSLAYLQGLLSGCERKNGWQMAEWMGEASPYAMQHLLDRASWDAELARQMIERALDAGAPVGWVAGDEVYGADSKVRRMLEARQRRKKLSLAACASAYPKCAICSPVCRGTANTACSTSSPGPTGVGPTNSWPSSTTTENANLPCLIAFGSSYLIDIYNCSTMCILVVRETLH